MGALDGIRVLDAGLLVQGPQAAATMSDWGADVIKVELPEVGDQSRGLQATPGVPGSAFFIACNRGKRSVTIDLRAPAGREVFLRLVEAADVVITNFKPGTMEAWGLGYTEVAARNPRIVYASSSAFGSQGPDASREGVDLSAQALGGLISTTGVDGGEVTSVGVVLADHIASQNLLSGILAALYARERSGSGQAIETSLLGGQIWAQASEFTSLLITGVVAGRSNRTHPLIPGLYGLFPTVDGWIAVAGVVAAARPLFFETIGRGDLTDRFGSERYCAAEKAELWPILDAVFRQRTTKEWCDLLGDAGLRHAPVRDHAQVAADPGVWANGYLAEVGAPDAGGVSARVVASPVSFSETGVRTGVLAPELGQHTEEVLLEIGFTWPEIAELSDAGAI